MMKKKVIIEGTSICVGGEEGRREEEASPRTTKIKQRTNLQYQSHPFQSPLLRAPLHPPAPPHPCLPSLSPITSRNSSTWLRSQNSPHLQLEDATLAIPMPPVLLPSSSHHHLRSPVLHLLENTNTIMNLIVAKLWTVQILEEDLTLTKELPKLPFSYPDRPLVLTPYLVPGSSNAWGILPKGVGMVRTKD